MASAPLQTALLHPQLKAYQTSNFFDDFYQYTTTQGGWVTAPAGSGSVALESNTDRVKLSSAASDNDFEGIRTLQACYLFQLGQGMYAESYMEVVNQATTTANVAFGFASSTTLGITNGASPSTSMTSALLLKLDGESAWRCFSSNGATNTSTLSTKSGVDGKYILRVDVFNFDNSNVGISYSVNGEVLRDSNRIPIIHKVAVSGAAQMYGVAQTGSGNGSANVQYHDYIGFGKNRLVSFT